MELARVIRELLKHPRILALGALIAVAASLFSVVHIENGTLKSRSLQYSAASTQVLVDSKDSVLGNAAQPFEPLAARAQVYANFMVSPAFLEVVGKQVGLSGSQLYATGPLKTNEPRVEREPTELKRNVQITGETKPYRLAFESQQELPTITINTQAPTTAQAVAMANAAASGLKRYVAEVEAAAGVPDHSTIVIRQLGSASGAVVNGGIKKSLAVMVFVVVFALWCVGVLLFTRFRQTWRESAETTAGGEDEDWSELPDPRAYGDAGREGSAASHPYDPDGHDFDTPSVRGDASRPGRCAEHPMIAVPGRPAI